MGGIDMSTAALEEILSNMRQVRNGVDYYTVTLLGTPEGKLEWSTLTHWCGFTEDLPPREIRQASLVYPERMIEFWKSAGQDYLVVNYRPNCSCFSCSVEMPSWNKPLRKSISQSGYSRER